MSPASPAHAQPCRTAHRESGPIAAEEVLLFDFGARVDGYRSDMTRTLFVGRADAA